MGYRWLADLVLVAHLGFLVFVVCGGLLVRRRGWVAWIHLPAAAWGAWTEFAGVVCPLTPLENHFRRLGGQQGYEGGFIEHYVTGTLYPEGLTREIQVVLGVLAVGLNVVIYGLVWRARRRTVSR